MTDRPTAGRTRLPGAPDPIHTWPGADGMIIAGDAWGPTDGPLVILQHGGGQTRHAWKGAGQRLGQVGYRAVAIDARGHGDSSWSPAGRYDQADMVADLVSVIQALGGEQRTAHLEACARRLTLPTLLVRGGLSDILSMEGAESFLEMCPHTEFVNVTDAAHMVAGDRNDIFSDGVIDFLARVVPLDAAPAQPAHAIRPRNEGPGGSIADVP